MSLLADLWILTSEHPATMGTFYAIFALILTAIVMLLRRGR